MLLNGSERVTVPNSNKNSRKSKKWFYNNEVCVMGVMNFFGFRGPIVFCPRNKILVTGNNLRPKRQKRQNNEQQNDCESNLELYLYLHMAHTIYFYVAYTLHT